VINEPAGFYRWEAAGESRATWYRREKKAEQAKTHYAADTPVSRISHAVITVWVI
jgi:hypothetical protein